MQRPPAHDIATRAGIARFASVQAKPRPPCREKGDAVKKTKPKRLDVFTDQKRAEAEAKAKTDSVEFMKALKPSKWVK